MAILSDMARFRQSSTGVPPECPVARLITRFGTRIVEGSYASNLGLTPQSVTQAFRKTYEIEQYSHPAIGNLCPFESECGHGLVAGNQTFRPSRPRQSLQEQIARWRLGEGQRALFYTSLHVPPEFMPVRQEMSATNQDEHG